MYNVLTAFAEQYGFSVLENLDPDEIEEKFLLCGDGKLFGKMNGTMNFMKLCCGTYHKKDV